MFKFMDEFDMKIKFLKEEACTSIVVSMALAVAVAKIADLAKTTAMVKLANFVKIV